MPSISGNNSGGGTLADAAVAKFSKILPLCIRKDGNVILPGLPETQNELKECVRVTVNYPSQSCGAMNPHKEISIRITNDENPLFYYYLRISEADFPELKTQQGLLVDFYGFPSQLVTLLEKCDNTVVEENHNSITSFGPKFVLVMKVHNNGSVLDIVESNPFKYLCHLSLQINAGSDADVKTYLCDVTTGLKKDYLLLQDKFSHLMSGMEDERCRMKEIMEQKNTEIAALKEQLHSQANSLSSKHFEDMTMEKEKLLKLQSDLASKFEQERSDMERRHSLNLQGLEERISHFEKENKDLLQSKYKLETKVQELTASVKHYENDLKLLQQEMTMLKKQNEKLDQDYHEKQRTSANLHNKVTVLETDLREKQGILQRQHVQITELTELKQNLADHAAAMVKEVERVQDVNKKVSGELIKANEIIKKLQDDARNLNAKSKLQNKVTQEQERVIIDREKTNEELRSQLTSISESLEKKNTEIENLNTSLKDSETKVELLEKTIKSNENMISWLNKQLNEFQGLSNLTKFRQNLALSAHQLSARTGVDSLGKNGQFPSGGNKGPITMDSERRLAGAPNINAPQGNTSIPNGTPSWMHIYQSTSTPLEDDLASRLEKVNAGTMNYNDIRSRFGDKFNEHIAPTSTGTGEEVAATDKSVKPTGVASTSSRPPTWARGRGGRVTLEMGGKQLSKR